MRKILLFLTALFTLTSINVLDAQELRMRKYGFWENWSMSAAVGANTTFADLSDQIQPKTVGPEVWISGNKDFNLDGVKIMYVHLRVGMERRISCNR